MLGDRCSSELSGRKLQRNIKKSQPLLRSATNLYGTVALSFVIPSEAEGSAVPRTSPGNAKSYNSTKLESRLPRRAVGPG